MLRLLFLTGAATVLIATPAFARDGHHRSYQQRYYNYWNQPYASNWYSPFGYVTGRQNWRYRNGYWGDHRRHDDWDDDDHHWRGDHDGRHWRGDDDDQGEDNDDQGEDD